LKSPDPALLAKTTLLPETTLLAKTTLLPKTTLLAETGLPETCTTKTGTPKS
jgi:hypothetical protein